VEHGPFDLLLHEPRQRRSWLIFDVSQKMKRVVVLSGIAVACAIGACAVSLWPPEPPVAPLDYASITKDLFVLTVSQRNLQTGVLSMRNDSPVAVSYAAYSERQPLYRFEVFRGSTWIDSTAWCGVGIKARILRAGRKLEVEVPFPTDMKPGESLRLAVGFSSIPRSDWERVRFLSVVYSNPLVYGTPEKG
jgi:hypothetical protein